MNFNPEVGIYDKAELEKIAASRRKIKEETGLSMYVITGAKKYYEKHKKKH